MNHYGDDQAIYRRPRRTDAECEAMIEMVRIGRVPKERDILKAILDYLAARRILAWRVNTGAVPASYNGKSRFIRFGPPGQADIQGVLPGGRYLAIEVKAAKGKVSEQQAAFLARVTEAGGVAGVCRSIEDVEELLRKVGVRL